MRGPESSSDSRVALITGASRGIGAAVCKRLAAEGLQIVINEIPGPRVPLAQSVADEICSSGGSARVVAADVSDELSVSAMISQVEASLGPVNVLVNNAAMTSIGRKDWCDITVQEWDRMCQVNLRGAYLCARAVFPSMADAGQGTIINVSSAMVMTGAVGALHYVTTKAGLIGFTRALAREVGGFGVRVNCVMPGAIKTENEAELFPNASDTDRFAKDVQSIERRGLPNDVASVVAFLVGSDSSFMTGQVLNVDGGWVYC